MKTQKTRTRTIFVVLTILAILSVFIAGMIIALPILKKTNVEFAKEQIDKIKQRFASTTASNETTKNYEIKSQDSWDVSKKKDGSVTAKWTESNKTIIISGKGEINDFSITRQYSSLVEKVIIESGVTSIGIGSFSGCNSLNSIKMADSITSIGGSAFNGTSITSISIPSGVKKVEKAPFDGCNKLQTIEIHASVTDIATDFLKSASSLTTINVNASNAKFSSENGVLFNKNKTELIKFPNNKKDVTQYKVPTTVEWIREGAFYGCSNLTSIEMTNSVNAIGEQAFYGCSNLTQLAIPSNVARIEDLAFGRCTKLQTISIQNIVRYINRTAFDDCNGLVNINVSSGNPDFTSENGVLFNKSKTELIKFPSSKKDTTYKIPSTVTSIVQYAFKNCVNLTSMDIPANVTNIEEKSFVGCTGIKSITIPSTVTRVAEGAIPPEIIIYVKADSEGHRYAEAGKQGYVLEGTASKISTNYAIPKEDSIKLSSYVTAKWTFSNRTIEITGNGEIKDSILADSWIPTQYIKLVENVEIYGQVTKIGRASFSGCENLKNVSICDSVSNIGEYAFRYCKSLTSINLNNVKFIGNRAFFGCTGLTDVKLPNNVATIEESAFRGCKSLTNINIPKGITRLEAETFSGCTNLKNIEIPYNVLYINGSAFEGCVNLANVSVSSDNMGYVVEQGVLYNKDKTEIVKFLNNNKNVTKYQISSNVKTIGASAFDGCNYLTSIEIPTSVTTIDKQAFKNCNNLTDLKIPSSVTSIGKDAIPYNVMIYVKANSEAHKYAEQEGKGYKFISNGPSVTFSVKEGATVQKTYTTKVDVKNYYDTIQVNKNSLKYQWTQSTNTPTKDSFKNSFTSGQSITKNSGDGKWYLWIYAEDNWQNATITRSEAFNFDNTAPTANVTYSTQATTKEDVVVTIKANEKIQTVNGWTLSSDKLTLTKTYKENATENVVIKDLVGNSTTVTVKITNIKKPESTVTINEYKIKGNYIIQIKPDTTYSDFIKNVPTNRKYVVKEGNKTLTEKDLIKTGQTLTTEAGTSYTLVVAGDINGDGKITLTELARIAKIAKGKITNIKELEKIAIDVNDDDKINDADVTAISKYAIDNK